MLKLYTSEILFSNVTATKNSFLHSFFISNDHQIIFSKLFFPPFFFGDCRMINFPQNFFFLFFFR